MLIRGWDVREDDGLLTAVRRASLSEYQERYGALAEVDSRDDGELCLLVDAQTRLADLLATAESVAVFARRRRQERAAPCGQGLKVHGTGQEETTKCGH